MDGSVPTVTVYIVTYRRPIMLRRAIASALAQTYQALVIKVVNDDPTDSQVADILAEFHDDRLSLFEPVAKRGATRNFNLMFTDDTADYVALLEDDNWWEPDFLTEAVAALAEDGGDLLVGNEQIWQELPQNGWRDTGQTLVPFRDTREQQFDLVGICGSARLCNSSMVVRRRPERRLTTPESIPVDVTEHFRERLFDRRFLFLGRPLVNYAETLRTARSTRGDQWSEFQYLLIGSVFAAAPDRAARRELARRLWVDCGSATSPRAVTLVGAALAVPAARSLLREGPILAVLRFAASVVKSPGKLATLVGLPARRREEMAFLVDAPLTRDLVGDLAKR